MNQIELRDVSVKYNSLYVLDRINLDIKDKEFIGILGPNGCGKSSLIKVIAGLIPYDGTRTISDNTTIGYVPQMFNFEKEFPITVQEVVRTGALGKQIKFFRKYTNEQIEKANDIMERLDILSIANNQIYNVSGGQLQKAIIARALLANPNVLLLDEPTASIDKNSTCEIFKLLKELNSSMTIIVICHDEDLTLKYADRIIRLEANCS